MESILGSADTILGLSLTADYYLQGHLLPAEHTPDLCRSPLFRADYGNLTYFRLIRAASISAT